jgi:uncharacterized protein (TIGR04255 family)
MEISNMSPECLESGAETGFPTLRNAPITEAVIDIRVKPPADIDLARLATFSDPFPLRFPEPKLRHSASAKIEFKGQAAAPLMTATGPTPDGYVFSAPAENLIAQARIDGFSLSKLKPYDSWKKFCPQFVELWDRYVSVAQPVRITRIALRYINRIELPVGNEFKEYILTFPEVAPGIPQGLPVFFARLVIPSPTGNMAVVTETNGGASSSPTLVPMIFDIDVFRDVDMEIGDAKLWSTIKDLRSYKNTIFFKSLTPKALEMFQ